MSLSLRVSWLRVRIRVAAELQRVAVEALAALKNQDTAAEALEDSTWTVEAGEIRVQTEVSKAMLGMVVNPEAEKVVRAALRAAGAGSLKLVLLPGTATAAEKKPRAAKTGSVQAKAMEHPIVQQAQRLFQAEIRNVIDLREVELMDFSDLGKMKEMMSQAKQMQEQMQKKLAETVVEASTGGGVVTVRMNGKKEVLRLKIEQTAMGSSADDLELLEDLIAAAVNEAGRKADEAIKAGMAGMMGALGLPDLPGLS